MPQKVVLDFDDFSLVNNKFQTLFKLREHFPKLKVSMFTVPCDVEYEFGPAHIFRDDALETLKLNLDWIQLIPHGLTHSIHEFENADTASMELTIKAIDEVFGKDDLPYEKGFKAPQWLWNKDVVDTLDRYGWWGAVDRNQPDMITPKKFYRYNFQAWEPFWLSDLPVLKIHGHINPKMDNDLEKCFLRLMQMPPDAEFHFVTDFLEDKK